MTEELFPLLGYGVKLSDLIVIAALGVSLYAAIASRSAAISAARREREREQSQIKIRADVRDVVDDNEGPGPQRHIHLILKAAQDGIADEIRFCEVLTPGIHHIEIQDYYYKIMSKGEESAPLDIILQEDEKSSIEFRIVLHYLALTGGESVMRFTGVRHDASRSPSQLNLKIRA